MSTSVVYTLLIYSSRPPEDPLPPAEDEAAIVHHRALQAEASERGDLLAVARLGEAGHGPCVRVHGGQAQVVDGPYIESKEWLVGFYLLECRDQQEAIARARGICTRDDTRVEVRPVTWHRMG